MRSIIPPSCSHSATKNVVNKLNSRGWRGRGVCRPDSKGFSMIPNVLLDHSEDLPPSCRFNMLRIRSMAHNQGGYVEASYDELGQRFGTSRSTAKIHMGLMAKAGYIEIQHVFDPATGCYSKNRYIVFTVRQKPTQVVENKSVDDSRGRVMNEPTALIKTVSANTELQTPLPPQGGNGVCESSPARPVPSREVHDSLQQARELRAQRKAEKRVSRYRANAERPRRHCKPLTPVQEAAVEVMRLCGVVETGEKIRDGIASAIALAMARDGVTMAKSYVERMVVAWYAYLDDPFLSFRYGIENFFSRGLWVDCCQWAYDKEKLKMARRW
jgi:hypothetical protein